MVGGSNDISSVLKEQRTAGDSSDRGDLAEVLGGADGLALPLIALALAAALLFAGGWIVYSAPLLVSELPVDGVMAASLYRRLAGAEPRHWLETAFRRTVWPFAATALLFCIAGVTMNNLPPEAWSIGDVKQNQTEKSDRLNVSHTFALRFANSAAKGLGRMAQGIASRMLGELKTIAADPAAYRGDWKPRQGPPAGARHRVAPSPERRNADRPDP